VKRSGPIKRKKGLTRRSEGKIAYDDELATMRPLVMARCHGICEILGDRPATEVHHRLRRSQGGTNELGNLMGVSAEGHRLVHKNPAIAYEHGWMLRRTR